MRLFVRLIGPLLTCRGHMRSRMSGGAAPRAVDLTRAYQTTFYEALFPEPL